MRLSAKTLGKWWLWGTIITLVICAILLSDGRKGEAILVYLASPFPTPPGM